MKAVLYDRVSTDEEKQDPRGHLDELAAYAAGRGWAEHSRWFDTVTGDPARRGADPPGLRRAIDEVAQLGQTGVLVVRDATRLVRSPIELLHMVARIQGTGANVVARDEGGDLDTTNDMGELVLFMRGWFGRLTLRFIRKQTRGALDQRRRQIRADGGFVSKRSGVWRTQLGRPRRDVAPLVAAAREVAGGASVYSAAKRAGVPRSSLRHYLAKNGAAK